jgi:thiol-disulfide isomerase/thioredoxin
MGPWVPSQRVVKFMSDRFLILVALSVILAMVFGTGLQMRKPQTVSPLLIEQMTAHRQARPLSDVMSFDASGAGKPFNSRITRPTVISFWATWCIPCLRELPTIAKFKAMADTVGIDVITVSEDKEGAGPPTKLLADKGLTELPLLVDADGSVAKAHRVKGMPTTLIVNAKGEELARMEGEVDWSQKASLDVVLGLLDGSLPTK